MSPNPNVKTFLYIRWWLTQRITTGWHAKNETMECIALNGTTVSYLILPRPRIILEEDRINLKAKASGLLKQSSACQAQQHSYTHELTRILTAFTRPAQNQSSQNPNIYEGGASYVEVSLLTRTYWKLMATRGENNGFVQGWDRSEAAHAWVDGLYPYTYR